MVDELNFEINSRIEVSWNDEYYKSTIENIEDGFIAISIPIKDGQYIPLRVGEKVEVIYYYSKDIYKFFTLVIGRRIDKIPLIVLAYPKEVFRIQRRKFVRVQNINDVEYVKLENSANQKPLKAVMVDLSGGGMRIKFKEDVKLGDKVKVWIPMGTDPIEVKGQVVRIEMIENTKRNICGVSFIDLEERIRERVIKFIFQVMRDQMKKGQ
jgi:c-di-GMP-binding flagellar brake protein YcgR